MAHTTMAPRGRRGGPRRRRSDIRNPSRTGRDRRLTRDELVPVDEAHGTIKPLGATSTRVSFLNSASVSSRRNSRLTVPFPLVDHLARRPDDHRRRQHAQPEARRKLLIFIDQTHRDESLREAVTIKGSTTPPHPSIGNWHHQGPVNWIQSGIFAGEFGLGGAEVSSARRRSSRRSRRHRWRRKARRVREGEPGVSGPTGPGREADHGGVSVFGSTGRNGRARHAPRTGSRGASSIPGGTTEVEGPPSARPLAADKLSR